MDNSPIPANPAFASRFRSLSRLRTPDRFRGRSGDYIYQAAILLAALLLILTATVF